MAPLSCPCGFDRVFGDPDPVTRARDHVAHHLATFPDVDQVTRDNLAAEIVEAMARYGDPGLMGAKMLTVRQPWAWAITVGAKTVENRATMWHYRGPVLIVAGKEWSPRGEASPLVILTLAMTYGIDVNTAKLRLVARTPDPTDRPGEPFPTGAVVAVANLVDVHRDAAGCCDPWGESSYQEAGGSTVTNVVHLVLDDIDEVAFPVPCRGALGLVDAPDDVRLAVAAQLGR